MLGVDSAELEDDALCTLLANYVNEWGWPSRTSQRGVVVRKVG